MFMEHNLLDSIYHFKSLYNVCKELVAILQQDFANGGGIRQKDLQ